MTSLPPYLKHVSHDLSKSRREENPRFTAFRKIVLLSYLPLKIPNANVTCMVINASGTPKARAGGMGETLLSIAPGPHARPHTAAMQTLVPTPQGNKRKANQAQWLEDCPQDHPPDGRGGQYPRKVPQTLRNKPFTHLLGGCSWGLSSYT